MLITLALVEALRLEGLSGWSCTTSGGPPHTWLMYTNELDVKAICRGEHDKEFLILNLKLKYVTGEKKIMDHRWFLI